MIKGTQIGDPMIKIVNFADNSTIFNCFNMIQVILKLYENAKKK